MAKLLRRVFSPILSVRSHEWPKTILMFLYFFLTITSYYILKPVRDSLFLAEYGAKNLPYAWLITIVCLTIVVSLYVKVVDYLEKNVLISATVAFFISNLILFWWGAHNPSRWLAMVFFVWVSIFSVMMVTQFWICANDLFNPREAKRLFGLVGTGGILGGIMGGIITNKFAMVVGTRNLLLVAAFLLLFCIVIINLIWSKEMQKNIKPPSADEKKRDKQIWGAKKSFTYIWKDHYLVLMVGIVVITKLVSTLVDYQFKNIIDEQIVGLDAKTAFFGAFFACLNSFSVIIQFFMTSIILRVFGVGVALALLPAGLMFGAVGILMHPVVLTVALVAGYDGGMNYSLNQSTKEMLYLPVPREVRYRVKPFIDMVAYRFSKGISSILILFFVNILHFHYRVVSFLLIPLIALWLYWIYKMRGEYVNEIRRSLNTEPIRVTKDKTLVPGVDLIESIVSGKDAQERTEIRRSLALYRLASSSVALRQIWTLTEIERTPENVRHNIQEWLNENHGGSMTDVISRYVASSGFRYIGEATSFILSYQSQNVKATALYFDSEDPHLRLAAILAVLLNGEDTYAEEALNKLGQEIDAGILESRELATLLARVSNGGHGTEKAMSYLSQCLTDDCSNWREYSQEKAKTFADEEGWMRAFQVLSTYKDFNIIYRKRLPYLIRRFLGVRGLDLLQEMIKDEETQVRDAALDAMKLLQNEDAGVVFNVDLLAIEFNREIDAANRIQTLTVFANALNRSKNSIEGIEHYLEAQKKRLAGCIQRIFQILSIIEPDSDAELIAQSMGSRDDSMKANAIELLDNRIKDWKLKGKLMLLLESHDIPNRESSSGSSESQKMPLEEKEKESLRPLITDALTARDTWILLSLYFVYEDPKWKSAIQVFLKDASAPRKWIQLFR